MSELKKVFEKHGLKMTDAVHTGISRQTVWFHWKGRRKVSGEMALKYESALGIPRWELRPDLWDAPADGN